MIDSRFFVINFVNKGNFGCMNRSDYILCARLNSTSILSEYGFFGDSDLFYRFLILCFMCIFYGVYFGGLGFIAGLM
jgi:hypothetical protein